MEGFRALKVEKEDGLLIITMNRPDKLNAMNGYMFDEFQKAFDLIESDPTIRAAVLTGAGRAFSTGGDFKQAGEGMSQGQINEDAEIDVSQKKLVLKMTRLRKPVIAAINGLAIGAGLNIALSCDLIYSADTAEFGTFFMKRAIIPEMGSTYLLPRIVGIHKAKELIFFAEKFSAKDALDMGLINGIFPADQLMEKVKELGQKLAKGPTVSLGLAKQAVNSLLIEKLEQALTNESDGLFEAFDSEDFLEGLLAFLEKREAKFMGK